VSPPGRRGQCTPPLGGPSESGKFGSSLQQDKAGQRTVFRHRASAGPVGRTVPSSASRRLHGGRGARICARWALGRLFSSAGRSAPTRGRRAGGAEQALPGSIISAVPAVRGQVPAYTHPPAVVRRGRDVRHVGWCSAPGVAAGRNRRGDVTRRRPGSGGRTLGPIRSAGVQRTPAEGRGRSGEAAARAGAERGRPCFR